MSDRPHDAPAPQPTPDHTPAPPPPPVAPAPGPVPPPIPPRRSHGCLYGCLIVLGVLVALGIIGGSVAWWYLNHAVKDQPTVKAAIVELNHNPVAQSVLGSNIEVTGASGFNSSTDLVSGTTESYDLSVKGSKAEGTLSVKSHTPHGGVRQFTEMTLTGPDGHTYNLLESATPPASTPINSTGGPGETSPPPANDNGGAETTPPPSNDHSGTSGDNTGGDNEGRHGGQSGSTSGDNGDQGSDTSGQSQSDGRSH
ncbi:MAG: hypothetical protein JO167_07800 [Alphaproteobacteria bacterium]|nr:hypothetical protein [Alphaproteobacteria bacterium]MBV9541158.1 hypothetical protein [Alphaproteobacteria bacterium]